MNKFIMDFKKWPKPEKKKSKTLAQTDLTLKFPGNEKVYIFEFKVVEEDKGKIKPLEQIRAKRYFEKYLGVVQKIFIIGIEFSRNERNLVSLEWEEARK